jgi:hypothetical protein
MGPTVAERGCDARRCVAIGDREDAPVMGAANTAPGPATSTAVTAANGARAGGVMARIVLLESKPRVRID